MRRTLLIALIIPLLLFFNCQRTTSNILLPAALVEPVQTGLKADFICLPTGSSYVTRQ